MADNLKVLDQVRLIEHFEDQRVYVVCESADIGGDVRVFPLNGGMRGVAHKDNLVLV